MISYDDKPYFASAADQNADLPVDLAGELRQVAGDFLRENPNGRNFSAVKLFDALELTGLQTGKIAVNAFDGRLLRLFKFMRADLLFHVVQELRPGMASDM
jgi:hypothetical protein